jgi:hypothetical protein
MPPAKDLKFGHTFTDHMLTIPWNEKKGWGTPEIKPCECCEGRWRRRAAGGVDEKTISGSEAETRCRPQVACERGGS